MRCSPLALAALLAVAASASANSTHVAEQVTLANAESVLFSGTDADGGIDDWYLTNGVVEAIIDDVALQDDLPPGVVPPAKQNEAALTGGSVLDLGLVGRDDDQLSGLFTIGGLSIDNFIAYDSISTSTTASSATITVEGTLLGFATDVQVVTEYTAAGSDPFLTITTTATNPGPGPVSGLGGFLDVVAWVTRAIVPFSPLAGRGFDHFELDLSSGPAGLLVAVEVPAFAAGPGNASPSDGVVDPPTGRSADEVAYGFLGVEASIDPDGPGGVAPTVEPVDVLFGVSSNLVTAMGNPPFGGIDLQPGGTVTYTRRLYVGARNDVASVANPMLEVLGARLGFATGTVSGDVGADDTPNVAASAIATRTGGPEITQLPVGAPITHFRTDADGTFSGVVLPVGSYDIEFRAPERDPVTVSTVIVAPGEDSEVRVPSLSGLGTVSLQVVERPTGGNSNLPVPARVTFKGVGDTPDPRFGFDFAADVLSIVDGRLVRDDLDPETFGGGPAVNNEVYLAHGTGEVRVRPGTYEVFASRGPEYTLQRSKIQVRAGRSTKANFRLKRVVDTRGAISADFHIHSARSLDSSAPLMSRVATFAGEGVEVMVSTDHDYHVDYAPVIAEMDLGAHVTSIVGNEVTASLPNPPVYADSYGHINAWPLPVDPLARRDGSIDEEFVAPNFIYSRLRAQGAEVIQYNHVRAGLSGLTSIGFFTNIGYDPTLPVDVGPNALLLDDDVTGASGVANPDGLRNIDFDAMEIANGKGIGGYLAVRRDWFSLLNQRGAPTASGPVPFIKGTAVSDTHRLANDEAGYARTFVRGAGDDPATLDHAVLNQNILAGNMSGSSGPYLEFALEDAAGTRAELGEDLVPASDVVTLLIRVQASNWIPVDEVRVYKNGVLDRVFDGSTTPALRSAPKNPFSGGTNRVVRFEAAVDVALDSDAYFVVEAGPKLDPLSPVDETVAKVVPGLRPLAFTNPIFVDLAGDGFDPPGVGTPAPIPAAASALFEAEKREQVRRHPSIYRIRIPESAAEAARARLSSP